MLRQLILLAAVILQLATCQRIGKKPEVHPKLNTQTCTSKHGCAWHDTSVVIDALTHPLKDINTGVSCETSSGKLNSTICPTAEKCAENCEFEGVDYASHGVKTHGSSMTLRMYLHEDGKLQDVSPRVYLLDESGKDYSMLQLLNQEVTFDADVSNLPCGMNGALYLSEMDASGGRSRLNPAGASYGTGYCDAQCFNTSSFINGVANVHHLGACCNEMDLWEANSRSTQLTPHSCNEPGFYECSGNDCGDHGVCDKTGCGFNPYTLGDQKYYGLHGTVNTRKPFTVVTQFLTDDGTVNGRLDRIRRLYVQFGKVIQNAEVKFQHSTIDSITPAYCKATASSFQRRGGLSEMGDALKRGMVLVFSIWNDASAFMNWLDSEGAGPCGKKEGNPTKIEKDDPTTSVTFSNIRWGDIGSTYQCTTGPCPQTL